MHQAEIQHPQATVGSDQDVVGLEVAVDELGAMGRRQAFAGAHEHVEHRSPVVGLFHPLAQRLAVDVLHRDEDLAVVRADVVDDDDVGMRQPGHRLCFAKQASFTGRAIFVAMQELECDSPVELRIVGAVDHAHAAAAELLEDHVPTDEAPAR